MPQNNTDPQVENWFSSKNNYVFTFAHKDQAIGVKVDVTGGTVAREDKKTLHHISDTIIRNGIDSLNIPSGELTAISLEDYLSDKYIHPLDDLAEEAEKMRQKLGLSGGTA